MSILVLLFLGISVRSIRLFRWVSGENTEDDKGEYGTKQTADPSNFPCSRSGHLGISINPTSHILFGGLTNNSETGDTCELNDLWLMDILAGPSYEWTWLSGGKYCKKRGEYGNQDVGDDNYRPGARAYSSGGKIKQNTDEAFFMFSGYGYGNITGTRGPMNDLWVYNMEDDQWKWMSGSSEPNAFGNYVTQDFSTANRPGARAYSSSFSISDHVGIFLFGWGYDQERDGFLNDVWLYDFSDKRWSWEHGKNEVDDWGIYGVRHNPSTENHPGGRCKSIGWKLPGRSQVMMFGGYGFDKMEDTLKQSGYLNDLWIYHYETREWEWISGSREINPIASYGVLHHFDFPTQPGGKALATGYLSDVEEVTLFGGIGYDEFKLGYLNDMFVYNFEIHQWKWIHGNRSVISKGVWGNLGAGFNVKNLPSSRAASVSYYVDKNTAYLFGGYGEDIHDNFGRLNDLFHVSLEKYCEFGENETDTCTGHGDCEPGFTCDCENNYIGNECDITWCGTYMSNHSDVCNNHGLCYEYDKCDCDDDHYSGNYCQDWECFGTHWDEDGVCGDGVCVDYNECDCGENYGGKDCTVPKCFGKIQNGTGVCGGNGFCHDVNTCNCKDFVGLECEELLGIEGHFYESTYELLIEFQFPIAKLEDFGMSGDFNCHLLFQEETYDYLGYEPSCYFSFDEEEGTMTEFLISHDTSESSLVQEGDIIKINSVTDNTTIVEVVVVYHKYSVWNIIQTLIPVFVILPIIVCLVIIIVAIVIGFLVCREVQKKRDFLTIETGEVRQHPKEQNEMKDLDEAITRNSNGGAKGQQVNVQQKDETMTKVDNETRVVD